MTNREKIYIVLTVLFSVLIITGNLTYQKFVYLPIFSIYTFELSVGAVIYPATFLITDLIAEFYGRDHARFCIRLAIANNIIIALLVMFMSYLNATEWSRINNTLFNQMFGFYHVAFIGSIIASYVAQSIDIRLYLGIKKLTGDKYLWLRNNVSTAFSLFVDTCIVIIFMAIFGAIDAEQTSALIINSYTFKLFFTIAATPVFYLLVFLIKRLK